jgi:outer membrane protein W
MRQVLFAAVLAALLPAAAAASPSLALRLGYASSSGSATKGTAMSEVAKAEFPLQLDATWRFGPHFSAGVYYGFAIGQLSGTVSDRCSALGASCSVWSMRAGIRGEYAFPEVSQRLAPWIGAGTGWEWVRESVSHPTESAAQTVSGWETLSLEGGADIKVGPKLWIGPYLTYRFGEYTRLDGYSIVNKAFHSWVGLGARGKWDF